MWRTVSSNFFYRKEHLVLNLLSNAYFTIEKEQKAREMAWWLTVCTVLVEDLISVPSTQTLCCPSVLSPLCPL